MAKRTFSESDFADSVPAGKRSFSESDFADSADQTMSNPKTGLMFQASTTPIDSFARGVIGQERESGYGLANIMEESGQNIGPIIGGTTGAPLGPGGVGAGAAIGRLMQTNLQNVGSMAGTGVPMKPAANAIGEAAVEGGLNYAGAKYLPPVTKAVGDVAKRGFNWAAESLGGVAKGTIEYAEKNLPTVSKYIGASKEQIGAFASDIRGALGGAIEKSEKVYRDIASKLSGANPEYGNGIKVNLKKALTNTLDDVERDFGYNAPKPRAVEMPRESGLLDQFGKKMPAPKPPPPDTGIPSDSVKRVVGEKDVALFQKFKSLTGQLENATPQQVYFFQRDLNSAILENEGKPIAAALGKIKSATSEFIDANQDKLPDLAKGNRAWAAAQELARDTRGFQNAEDMVQYIKNAFSAGKYDSSRRAMLEEVGQQVPEVGKIIGEVRGALAAEQLGPLYRGLPQTGMGAGIVTGVGAAGVGAINPLLLPLAATGSPRAYYYGLKAAPGISRAYGALAERAPQAVGATLMDHYMRQPATP